MQNRIGYNRLGRKASHRKALHKNMVSSLLIYGRVRTTLAKAREVRRTVEKLITRARNDSVHNRRIAGRLLTQKAVLHRLFTEVAPRFMDRPGGYTRILRVGRRKGDAAEMALFELLDYEAFTRKRGKVSAEKSETGNKQRK